MIQNRVHHVSVLKKFPANMCRPIIKGISETLSTLPLSQLKAIGLLVILTCVLTGCGKEMVQVSGQVKVKGESEVPGAIRAIRFEPLPDSTAKVRKAASGDIAKDGSFTLFTRQLGDGVYPGKYAVTFTLLSGDIGGKILVKPEYMNADVTPYVVEVENDMNDLVYEVELR